MNNKIKRFLSLLGVFLLGMAVATILSEPATPETQTETETVTITQMDYSYYDRLKAVDDEIITAAGQGLESCGVAFDAVSRLDYEGVAEQVNVITDLTDGLDDKFARRNAIIEEVSQK
jgi:hypothetical protein